MALIITTQPQSVLVNQGDDATFTVTVSSNIETPTIAYKWQRADAGSPTNFSDIGGGTSDTLVITTDAADDNDKIRVVVEDDDSNPVTSSVATLAVRTIAPDSAAVYSPWEVSPEETGQNRVRRLHNLGYL